MSKLTVYFPDSLEKQLRSGAKTAKMSLSAYLAGLLGKKLKSEWPKSYFKLYGAWKDSVSEPVDQKPEVRKNFDL